METVTISKKEYKRLKEAEKKLESSGKLASRFTDDQALLKLSESAFVFWDNTDDSTYDNL